MLLYDLTISCDSNNLALLAKEGHQGMLVSWRTPCQDLDRIAVSLSIHAICPKLLVSSEQPQKAEMV